MTYIFYIAGIFIGIVAGEMFSDDRKLEGILAISAYSFLMFLIYIAA